MDIAIHAQRLASLGHEQRLEIFRALVVAGKEGLSIGELQAMLNRPASTVSFHLRELVKCGMVMQEKSGRTIRCHANFQALNEALTFVKKDCCRGVTLPVFTEN